MQTHVETEKDTTKDPGKLKARLDELKRMRDEIRVKIHLAGMDARDAFHEIEPEIDKAEHELTRLGKSAVRAVDKAEHELTHLAEDAAEAAARTLDSLAAALHRIRDRLPK